MKEVLYILDADASKVEGLGLLAWQKGLFHYPGPPDTLIRIGSAAVR